MRLTALPPLPPTPMTLILAALLGIISPLQDSSRGISLESLLGLTIRSFLQNGLAESADNQGFAFPSASELPWVDPRLFLTVILIGEVDE